MTLDQLEAELAKFLPSKYWPEAIIFARLVRDAALSEAIEQIDSSVGVNAEYYARRIRALKENGKA